MPNFQNISSPISLVSFGRSGSSLISEIFQRHPDFASVGETGNLIGDLWQAYEFSSGVIAPEIRNEHWMTHDERAGEIVRSAFVSAFPDQKKNWFQKPIGLPRTLSNKFGEAEWDEAAVYYWSIMKNSFPHAKYFTVLRHPYDVVLSAKSYWGFDEASIWWSYAFFSYILSHPSSLVRYAISYDKLVSAPENTVRDFFAYLDIDFDYRVMAAFETVHSAASDSRGPTEVERNRGEQWGRLNLSLIKPKYFDSLQKLFLNFGFPLPLREIPPQSSGVEKSLDIGSFKGVSQADTLDDYRAQFSKEIERVHSEYGKKMRDQERERFELFSKYENWISELTIKIEWLEKERKSLIDFISKPDLL